MTTTTDPPIFPDPFSSLPIPDDFHLFDDEAAFDITFDDFNLPSDTEEFLNSNINPDYPEFNEFVSDPDIDVNGSDVSMFLNVPETPVSSQGSGNCASGGSGGLDGTGGSNCSSAESGNSVVEQKVKCEGGSGSGSGSGLVLKRKNERCDGNVEARRTSKYRRSNEECVTTENENEENEVDEKDEKEDKKKARLIRNRESAQLSRQRKKHYVEELEDKVRAMHATIQDLNARITYFAAENATLKQQMVGGGVGGVGGGGVCSAPVMYPPHPAMAPMGYPWMPCPPYVVKSQGSQVPLVPIPRLKPQPAASVQKPKKVEVKKSVEGVSKSKPKTKKVASISFLGMLLFMLMFGGLVPIMNVKFGGVTVTDGVYSGKSKDYKLYNQQQHHGRVLIGDEHYDHLNGTKSTNHNASEPLIASLYVPRNDKLVKIDGNLIIHSVLASEKAMASREEQGMSKKDDNGLTSALDLVPAISIPAVNRNGVRQPHMYRTSSDHQRALPSDKDGKLQQWFREGLAGPMLSSGMCTEVFQFDVSVASGAIVPATSVVNRTATKNHSSTYITTVKNRRILHGLPIPLSATNITKEKVAATAAEGNGSTPNEPSHNNNSVSSMVVSVLFDPREAGDGSDVEGMMGGGGGKGKSFSRIFVVVLLDSVKYVTYSCMLPIKGASHLVTA